MPISQQQLCRFGPYLAWRWILTVALWILKIRMIGHMVWIPYYKKSCPYVLFTIWPPISQQRLGWFGPNLAAKWVLSVPLGILKIRMIAHIVQILYYKNRLCVCPCVCLFNFKCLFLSERTAEFNQSWHEGEYCQWLYDTRKLGSSVIRSGFHIIKNTCPYVSISLSVTHFSATNGTI